MKKVLGLVLALCLAGCQMAPVKQVPVVSCIDAEAKYERAMDTVEVCMGMLKCQFTATEVAQFRQTFNDYKAACPSPPTDE